MNEATIFITVAAKCGHLAKAFAEDIDQGGEYEAECIEGCGNVSPVESLEDRGAWDKQELIDELGL